MTPATDKRRYRTSGFERLDQPILWVMLFYRRDSAPAVVGHFAIFKKHPPIPKRIIRIVCQIGHTSRDCWCKVAHRVLESDDL